MLHLWPPEIWAQFKRWCRSVAANGTGCLIPADAAPAVAAAAAEAESELLELKRGNLLLEREKLSLEIQVLKAKMGKLNPGNL